MSRLDDALGIAAIALLGLAYVVALATQTAVAWGERGLQALRRTSKRGMRGQIQTVDLVFGVLGVVALGLIAVLIWSLNEIVLRTDATWATVGEVAIAVFSPNIRAIGAALLLLVLLVVAMLFVGQEAIDA